MTGNMGGGSTNKAGLVGEIVKNLRLVWRLLRDGRVSTGTKLLLPGLALGYLLFPADLLPDFLPLLGQLDDIAIVALGIKFFIDMCPPGIVSQLREELTGRAGGEPGRHNDKAHAGEVLDGEFRVIE